MDKSHALQIDSNELNTINTIDGTIKIYNYDFHEKKTNEKLYCVAEPTTFRDYKWKLKDRLYSTADLLSEYQINSDQIPKTIRTTLMSELDKTASIYNLIENAQKMSKIPWHKVFVFERRNNKIKRTDEVSKKTFINAITNMNVTKLIPIVMFDNSNQCSIEYVWPVELKELGINILISFENSKNGTVKATGIHLDKTNILKQHKLISAEHECHCLDNFDTNISNLIIHPQIIDEQPMNPFESFVQKLMSNNIALPEEYKQEALKLLNNKKHIQHKSYEPDIISNKLDTSDSSITPTTQLHVDDMKNNIVESHSMLPSTTINNITPQYVINSIPSTIGAMPPNANNSSNISPMIMATPGALPYYPLSTLIPILTTQNGVLQTLNSSIYTKYYPAVPLPCNYFVTNNQFMQQNIILPTLLNKQLISGNVVQ